MADYLRRVGNYAKLFVTTPLDGNNAEITSFPTGTTVAFVTWPDGTTVETSRLATIVTRPDGGKDFSYQPIAPELDLPGTFGVRWDITYPGSVKDSWPVPGHQVLVIQAATG